MVDELAPGPWQILWLNEDLPLEIQDVNGVSICPLFWGPHLSVPNTYALTAAWSMLQALQSVIKDVEILKIPLPSIDKVARAVALVQGVDQWSPLEEGPVNPAYMGFCQECRSWQHVPRRMSGKYTCLRCDCPHTQGVRQATVA